VATVGSSTRETAHRVIATGDEVVDVTELGPSGERFVSLRLPVADASRVAVLDAEGGVRLVQVSKDAGR
jgi:hypothetical protein